MADAAGALSGGLGHDQLDDPGAAGPDFLVCSGAYRANHL